MAPEIVAQADAKNSPISIRLGEMDGFVRQRTLVGSPLPATIRRDLSRYYEIMDDEKNRLSLTGKEAAALVDAIGYRALEKSNWQLIWAMVEAHLRDHPGGFGEAERSQFTERLRAMRLAQTLHVVDAIECFRIDWLQSREEYEDEAGDDWDPREQAFYEAGLTRLSPKFQFEADQMADHEEDEE